MCELTALVEQCERDTRRLLSAGAASRLGNWRRHADSQAELVNYIKRLLRGDHRRNGWQLDQRGGLSLEAIVLDRCPELFDQDDFLVARETLGRA